MYNVEETEQGYYVVVPEGSGEPLPALFASEEQAQRMARSLGAKREKPGGGGLIPDALPSR